MSDSNNAITILIKPSSEKCNLKCSYCFYHDISAKRKVKDYGFMSDETARSIIDNAFDVTMSQSINFAFQGGEPTLIGLQFYYDFVEYVKHKQKTINKTVEYSLQTNGTPLTPSWITFLKENNFLVGLSLDGTKEVHDTYRIYSKIKKNGSYEKVVSVLNQLKENHIRFNLLAVVTGKMAREVKTVYPHLKELGAQYIQFIPCLDPWGEKPQQQQWSLSADDYGYFLSELFMMWQQDVYNNIAPDIRYFNNILGIMFGVLPESCDMRGTCAIQNVVEADGSIYPCDFYAFEYMKLGHVQDTLFDQLHLTEKAQNFLSRSYSLPEDCKKCNFLQLCRTGCQRHNETQEIGSKNRFCSSYLYFFNKHIHEMEKLAQYINLASHN